MSRIEEIAGPGIGNRQRKYAWMAPDVILREAEYEETLQNASQKVKRHKNQWEPHILRQANKGRHYQEELKVHEQRAVNDENPLQGGMRLQETVDGGAPG